MLLGRPDRRDEDQGAGHTDRGEDAGRVRVHDGPGAVGHAVAIGVHEPPQRAGRAEVVGAIAGGHQERAVRQAHQAGREVEPGGERGDPEVVRVHPGVAADGELGGRGLDGGDEQ